MASSSASSTSSCITAPISMGHALLQGCALEGHGDATAQGVQIDIDLVRRADHGEADQGAFSGSGLEDGAHSGSRNRGGRRAVRAA